MKPRNLGKSREKEKVYDRVSKRKDLKIIMMNIINYQMLEKISLIKNSSL